MISWVRSLSSSKFARNVGVLASGTIAGQAIMVLILPVLTRLYDPGAFGLLGVYTSLVMVLSVAACLRLEIAVPLPEDDRDAFNLVVLGGAAATAVAVVLSVATVSAPEVLARWLRQADFVDYLWLVPIGVWLAAIYSVVQFWSVRKGRYGPLARTHLSRAIGGAGTQTVLGLWQATPIGLLVGHIVYTGLGTVGLARLLWKNDRHLLAGISGASLLRNLVQQKRFPLYSVPEAFLNTAAISAPLILIAAVVNKQEAGFMLLAQRVTSIPVGLIGGSISRVFLAEAAQKKIENRLAPFTRKIMLNLVRIGVVPFVVLALLAPVLFPLIFGNGWTRAGEMVTWMVPYMFLQFVSSPVSTILHATGNQFTAMILQLVGFSLLIGSIVIAASVDAMRAFEYFAIAAFIYYSIYLAVILFLIRKERNSNSGEPGY